MNELNSFFKEVSSPDTKTVEESFVWRLAYICCSEFGWTQEEFFNTEIPFIFCLLDERTKFYEEERKRLKKK